MSTLFKVFLAALIGASLLLIAFILIQSKQSSDYAQALVKSGMLTEGKTAFISACYVTKPDAPRIACNQYADKHYDEYFLSVEKCGMQYNVYSQQALFVKCLLDNGVAFNP